MKPHFETPVSWNVIFLIYAEISDNSTPGSDDSDVALQIKALEALLTQTALYDPLRLFYIKNTVVVKDNTVHSDQTVIFEVIRDTVESVNSFEPLKTFSVQDFVQKEQCVERAFQLVEDQTGPRQTLLITWDHGSAFGIFKKTVQDPSHDSHDFFSEKYTIIERQKGNGREDLLIIRNKPVKANFFSQEMDLIDSSDPAADEPTFMDILSNDRLAKAITNGFSAKRVEALLMYNCDMQNIHTAYSLRNCVDCLIAPETTIASPGYDYRSIIEFIGQNTVLEITGAMIGVQAVRTLQSYYEKSGDPETLNRYAIFAVSLEHYGDVIIDYMSAVVRYLMKRMNDDIFAGNIKAALCKCYNFGEGFNYHLVDFLYFMKKLAQIEQEMQPWYIYLQTALDSVIISRLDGDDLYPAGGSTQKAENAALGGFTIYFTDAPLNAKDAVVREFVLPNSPFSSKVIQAIGWKRFLDLLNAKTKSCLFYF